MWCRTDPIEVFDDAAWKIRLHLDGHFNQLVEMVGAHLKHLQNPGENPAIRGTLNPHTYVYNIQ